MSMADKWPKMDKDLEERIDGLVGAMPLRRKKMFGTSAWFLESNDLMLGGVWGDGVMVRVGESEAGTLVKGGDAEQFDPMGGRPMREYVFLDSEKIAEDNDLIEWFERAAGFTSTLPARKKKAKKKPAYKG